MLPAAGFSSDSRRTTRDSRRRILPARQLGWVGGALIVVALLLLATPVVAQNLPTSPILEFDQAGPDVKGYVLYVTRREDGVSRRIEVGLPSKSPSGRLQVPLPPLEKGTWRVELAAYNDAGESPRAKAEPPEIRVDPASPQKPPAAKGESKRPPEPAKKPAPPKDPKKTGAMGKLWRFIVGSDEP
jgi:hypothetical protein